VSDVPQGSFRAAVRMINFATSPDRIISAGILCKRPVSSI
jgi:hypothetical protein